MIREENITEKAIAFAAEAWQGKTGSIDKKPYIINVMERVVTMTAIDPTDKDLMAAAALYHMVENTAVSWGDIEAEFGPRMKNILYSAIVAAPESAESLNNEAAWIDFKEQEISAIKKLPLKIKMLVFADKMAEIKEIHRHYQNYRDDLWHRMKQKNPKLLAWYYYQLSGVLTDFEEYDTYSEFNSLVAQTFVNYK